VHYQVRNRSDRPVQHVEVLLGYNGLIGAGVSNSASISPGQTGELIGCGFKGSGGVRTNPMKILIAVESTVLDDCAYRPSFRVPLSLGITPNRIW